MSNFDLFFPSFLLLPFPSGIHYIGDLLEHKPFRCMLDQMTNGQLQWVPLDNPFDQVVLGPPENRRVYPIYSGRDRFPNELKRLFPGEDKAIDEYMRLVKVLQAFFHLLSIVYIDEMQVSERAM